MIDNQTVPDILRRDADKYESKAADYAPDPENPFENFRFAGMFADRLMRDAPDWLPVHVRREMQANCTLIGVKISRLMTLGLFGKAKNEDVLDTVKDDRVYGGILEAMMLEAETFRPKPPDVTPNPDTVRAMGTAARSISAGQLVSWADLTAPGTANGK